MPEPSLYLQGMGAAALVSALCALAGARRPASSQRLNSACVLGLGLGLVVGCYVLSWRWAWPPVHGLDRFLTIVFPTALGIELIASFPSLPRWAAWFLRMCLAMSAPRILLHGSVYLNAVGSDWSAWQAGVGLAGLVALLAGLGGILAWL